MCSVALCYAKSHTMTSTDILLSILTLAILIAFSWLLSDSKQAKRDRRKKKLMNRLRKYNRKYLSAHPITENISNETEEIFI